MHLRLLDVLGCPRCHGALSCFPDARDSTGDVRTGTLWCAACSASYPISSGVPCFVPDDVYASSFGYRWNRFRTFLDVVAESGATAPGLNLTGEKVI